MKNWAIVYKNYTRAVGVVFSAVSKYVTPICIKADEVTDENQKELNLIYVGENPFEKAPCGGYKIKVSNTDLGTQRVVITGDGEINTLYAANDFENVYLIYALEHDVHQTVYQFHKLFIDPLPVYDLSSVPSIKDRSLWTWGYVIYDYKRYIDNMVKLKLNMLIIWNDCVPVNAEELIDYAHKNGIKVIWGFEWGWGIDCMQADVLHLDKIRDRVIEKFQRDYAHLNSDGIYFQTFTETTNENIGDINIAEAAVQLVNETSAKLLELYPDLHIQFGLHALSVKHKLDIISRVDNRVTIIWEDCGAMPFANMAKDADNFEETVEFTKKIKNLRDGGFGVVLKGLIGLDWSKFSHQPGSFVLGEYNRNFVRERTETQMAHWKFIQAYWLRNARCAYEMIKLFDRNTITSALVEDGYFEEKIFFPVALYAAMLWDNTKSLEDIMCETALRPDVDFA